MLTIATTIAEKQISEQAGVAYSERKPAERIRGDRTLLYCLSSQCCRAPSPLGSAKYSKSTTTRDKGNKAKISKELPQWIGQRSFSSLNVSCIQCSKCQTISRSVSVNVFCCAETPQTQSPERFITERDCQGWQQKLVLIAPWGDQLRAMGYFPWDIPPLGSRSVFTGSTSPWGVINSIKIIKPTLIK